MREINLGGNSKLTFRGDVPEDVAADAMVSALATAAKYKQLMDSDPKLRSSLRLRYMFEHRGLPWLWFRNPSVFTPESTREILGITWASTAKLESMEHPPEFPYIKEEHLELDEANVILLRMPVPLVIPFCYRIAMVSFRDGRKPLYLTQEKSMLGSGLCSWMVEGEHSLDNLRHGNYGKVISRTRSEFISNARAVMAGALGLSSSLELGA